MSSSTASNIVASLALAALITTDNGSPPASLARWSLDPALPRSTGFAPVRSPFDRAQAERVDACAGQVDAARRTQLIQQQRLKLIEHPGAGPLIQPPPAGGRRPTAQLLGRQQPPRGGCAGHEDDRGHAGPIRHGARHATARSGGWRRSSGWIRCHSASGRSLSARVVMSGDHRITQPGALPHVPECPVSEGRAQASSGYQRLSAAVAWGSAGAGVGAGAGRRVHWRPNSRITGIVQTSGTSSQMGRCAHQARLG